MIFKRKEGFRFVFGDSLEADFVILIDGKAVDLEGKRVPCQILDISPRGMKIGVNMDLGEYSSQILQLEILFVLDQTEIKAVGEIVWSKTFGSGYQYGIVFYNQTPIEELIIEELKSRRRKEVARPKLKEQ